RVLDVGCGAGVLVLALARAGLPAPRGVDPQATTRGFPGGGGIEAAGIEHAAGPFDLVTFHHSLEHVADPRAQLVRARALLAPGGRIVVRCPTTSGAAFRRYGDRWVALDAPRHLVIPSRAGMVHLARRAGLRVESVRDDATAMQFWASEQYRRDMALMDPRSRMRAPWRPSRDWARLLGWWRATRRLNASGDGDQAAWVLAPAGEDGTPGGDPVRA
ncbi:MAG: class I SAM-dependent methyltransferase, partial [Thermoleophilia bacterium]|nr:class I SAM-dependent methyltransferase [Thermoleophilia bacterium]